MEPALAYHECVGDDLDVKDMVSFPQLVIRRPTEGVFACLPSNRGFIATK
jgi:hypothetical protein